MVPLARAARNKAIALVRSHNNIAAARTQAAACCQLRRPVAESTHQRSCEAVRYLARPREGVAESGATWLAMSRTLLRRERWACIQAGDVFAAVHRGASFCTSNSIASRALQCTTVIAALSKRLSRSRVESTP